MKLRAGFDTGYWLPVRGYACLTHYVLNGAYPRDVGQPTHHSIKGVSIHAAAAPNSTTTQR